MNKKMIPWCLFSSSGGGGGGGGRGTVKLIRSDGLVKIYDRPVHVAELTTEFPKHSVCRSDSFYIGQKIPTLSEQDHLQPGNNYFLLPTHFFQSALSFVSIASFAAATTNNSQAPPKTAFLKKAASCQPFQIQKTPSGRVRIRVTEEFLAQLIEQGRMREEEEGDEKLEKDERSSNSSTSSSIVCNTPELQKEYSQLVEHSRRCCWKPKLETIRESSAKKMKRLGSFGIKMGSSKKNPQG